MGKTLIIRDVDFSSVAIEDAGILKIKITNMGSVTIVDGSAKAIYYTIDGSTPTISSPQYSGEFIVEDGAEVKAISLYADGSTSVVVSGGKYNKTSYYQFTPYNFNTTDGINYNWKGGRGLMCILKKDTVNKFPTGDSRDALNESFNLLDVHPSAKGVKITCKTVDKYPSLYHGVNLESTTKEENTNVLGWTLFTNSLDGVTYTFPDNWYKSGYRWLKCVFKNGNDTNFDYTEVNSDNFKIEFIY